MPYEYGQFGPDHLKKIQYALELFNEQKYWECHEELEDLWMEDLSDHARNVYWAIIQVAASMIHYRDKKILGAQGMLHKAKNKFKKCEDLNVETDLLNKYLEWQTFKKLARAVPEDSKLEDFEDLFDFRFRKFQKKDES